MCIKLLIEKAITSENYSVIVMMIDMSKAFDTVNRKTASPSHGCEMAGNSKKNKELYEKTGVEKWSSILQRRRLSWLGHFLRLDEETPTKKALAECLRKIKKNCGRRKPAGLTESKRISNT